MCRTWMCGAGREGRVVRGASIVVGGPQNVELRRPLQWHWRVEALLNLPECRGSRQMGVWLEARQGPKGSCAAGRQRRTLRNVAEAPRPFFAAHQQTLNPSERRIESDTGGRGSMRRQLAGTVINKHTAVPATAILYCTVLCCTALTRKVHRDVVVVRLMHHALQHARGSCAVGTSALPAAAAAAAAAAAWTLFFGAQRVGGAGRGAGAGR